jgi:diacylglycerol kinase (ATP)
MTMTANEWPHIDAPHHVLAIVNPVAGVKRGSIVLERLKALTTPRITLHTTTPDFDYAGVIQDGVAQGADRLLLAGGDGTLMQGVTGALHALGEDHDLPVGWVPVGTGNVVSGFLGIPHRIDPALRLALGAGYVREIDLAKIGERYSVMRVSTGLEADIAAGVKREELNRLGLLAYGMSSIRSLRQSKPVEYFISLDGQPPLHVEGITAFITATGALTWINGLAVINEAIQPDDGLLYAGVWRPLNAERLLANLTHLMAGNGFPPESILYFTARKRIVIDTKESQPSQIDGEPLGTTPMIADLLPHALRILVPHGQTRGMAYLDWLSGVRSAEDEAD